MLLSTVLGGELALKWLLESPNGVRWLLGAVSRHTVVTISARTITGDLDSALRLEGLSAHWPGGDLSVDDVRLRCRPMRIPFGYVAVRELILRGVRFIDSSPPDSSEPEIVWPHVTGIPTKLHGWIDLFKLEDATYQKQKRQPVKIPDVSASLLWRDSRLSVTNLSLKTAEGVLSGTVTAGFGIASLDSLLAFEPHTRFADCSKIQLRTKLHAGQLPEQVAGEMTVTALSGANLKYSITGDIGLTRKELNLHRLTATEKGRGGTVNLSGTLPLAGEAALQLTAAGLDLTRELGKKVALSGTLDLKGESRQYAGEFNISSSGSDWLKTGAAGRFRGDLEGIELSVLDSSVLDGVVRGDLRFGWRNGVTVKGALHGKGLNPAIIDPAWIGVVNFDLDSFMATLAGGRLRQGEMHGRLKESRLRGKALSGEIAVALKNDDLNIERLFLTGDGFDITASGTLSQRLDMKADITDLSGGYADGRWQGKLTDFSGHDTIGPYRLAAPTAVTISADYLEITQLILIGLAPERVELSGRFYLKPRTGTAEVSWNRVNLARANRWLKDASLDGESSGKFRLGLAGDDRMTLTGKASAFGAVTLDKKRVNITKALLDLDAGGSGTTAIFELRTKEGISAAGKFISPQAATLSVPPVGELQATWEGLDPALARRWLPKGGELHGLLSGAVSGKFLPEQRYDLNGTVTLSNGSGSWRDNGRELSVAIRTAGLRWSWRDDSLRGEFSLSLANLGESKGDFQLPLPSRFGVAINRNGQIKGTISGTFEESGVINAFFPGLLQEARSLVKVDLHAGGTWQTPTVNGTVGITHAGAYIPSAGIRVSDVQLDARLNASPAGTEIQIDKFRLTAGKGFLEGGAGISFAGSKLTGYQGTLRGERFQALNLPEQQLVIAPDLTFAGNLNTLSARGVIQVPEMLLRRFSSTADIKPSGDVIVLGREKAASLQSALSMDLQLRILLGDKVFVNYRGLDARLEGGIKLAMTDLTKATGNGEIKVAKGSYRIYGVNLEIERGRAIFSGGPVERPTLDILALRTVDDVRAGVTITGIPEEPLIKLYSEPALPDTDVLSYVVLGRTLGESGSQGAILMEAASLFVSSDNSAGLQEQLKEWIALDTLTLSSGKDQRSGYKTVEPSLRGNTHSSTNTNGVSHTMLELGKYLTPKLYVSYGKSLFDQSQQVRARYSISKGWEVESKFSAAAAGGDLLYRIELK